MPSLHGAALGGARWIAKNVRGVRTVLERRGVGYFAYLVRGVLWPRLLYRFVWGTPAPAVARVGFFAASALTSVPPDVDALRQHALLGPEDHQCPLGDRLDDVERLMDRAHRVGVTGVASAFDHLVRLPDGSLAFGWLPHARRFPKRSARYLANRDADREAFNKRFGTQVLTEREVRRALAAHRAAVPDAYRYYAPIDFGGGLTIGQIASTDSGTGRWEFFNRAIVAPLVTGKRVVDLGSNNGSLPLMMARDGARSVLGLEITPEIAEFARLNVRILEWRDVRRYDITIVTGDMRMFLSLDPDSYDVVTAFCSLYYLPPQDMGAIVTRAAEGRATLLLQANEAIGSNCPGTADDLVRLMRDHGYPNASVYAPLGYSRPLLVGMPPE
jgi:SAM-dependent methyltransferase